MPTLLLRRFQTLISSIHNKNFVKILKLKISCLFVSVKNVLRLRYCSIGQLVRHNILSKNMKPCKKMYFIFYLEKVFMTKKTEKDIYSDCKNCFALSDPYLTAINVERCIFLCNKTVCNEYIGNL